MNNIKVTVICYVYNHEKYVRQCLDGFVMQKTDFRFEVIVHDDASTDNSQEIILEYAKNYPDLIKPIIQKNNQYQNGGDIYPRFIQKRVNGEYIAICEGDDYWIDEYKLQKQYNRMKTNEDCSFCVSKVLCCDKDGNFTDKVYPQEDYLINNSGVISGETMITHLYSKRMYPFQTSSYFVKKEVYDKTQEIFVSLFDRNIMLTGSLLGNFYYIDEPMSVYRRFTETSWSLNTKNMDKKKKNEQYIQLLNYDYIFDEYTKHIYHDQVINRVCIYLNNISKTNSEQTKLLLSKFKIRFSDLIKRLGAKQTITLAFSIAFPRISNFIRSKLRKTL